MVIRYRHLGGFRGDFFQFLGAGPVGIFQDDQGHGELRGDEFIMLRQGAGGRGLGLQGLGLEIGQKTLQRPGQLRLFQILQGIFQILVEGVQHHIRIDEVAVFR